MNGGDTFMPGQRYTADAVADIGKSMAGCFGQRRARGQKAPIPGEAKRLLSEIFDQLIACEIAAGRCNLDGEFCQSCPKIAGAWRVVRMEGADGAFLCKFF